MSLTSYRTTHRCTVTRADTHHRQTVEHLCTKNKRHFDGPTKRLQHRSDRNGTALATLDFQKGTPMTTPTARPRANPVQRLNQIHRLLVSIPIFVATGIGLCTVLKLLQTNPLSHDPTWLSAEILLDCANLSMICLAVFVLFHGWAVALTLYVGRRWPRFWATSMASGRRWKEVDQILGHI